MEQILPSIRDYSDYRRYLKDFFESKKKLNPAYSHRVFIRKAEMTSPSHLKMIMDGKRNLTSKTVRKYVNAIGLKKKDAQFFELLVNYNQEQNPEEKIKMFQDLMLEKKKKGLSTIEEAQFAFLSKWHYVAIYVLIDLIDFEGTPEWISSRLKKKVSIPNIETALEHLLDLGLIEKDPSRGFRQTNGPLDTSDEIQSLAFRSYHKNMAELGIYSLDNELVNNREFNGVTIPVEKAKLGQIKEMIRNFRKELNEVASNMENPDEVYQMNIHFFPLTEVRK